MAAAMEIDDGEEIGMRPQPGLECSNQTVLNVGAFLLTMATMLAIHFGVQNFQDRQDKFSSIVSTAALGDWIWVVIGLTELVFIVAQTTCWRAEAIIGVITPWWIATCAFQIGWSLAIAIDWHFGAMLCMVAVFTTQVFLCLKLDDRPWLGILGYWFCRVPFSIHAAWALVLAVVDTSIWATHQESLEFGREVAVPRNRSPEISIAITSLGTAFTIMTAFAIGVRRPDPLFCAVFGWGMFAMAERERLDRNNELLASVPKGFDATVVVGFTSIYRGCTFIAACFAVLATFLRIGQRFCIKEQGKEITVIHTVAAEPSL